MEISLNDEVSALVCYKNKKLTLHLDSLNSYFLSNSEFSDRSNLARDFQINQIDQFVFK